MQLKVKSENRRNTKNLQTFFNKRLKAKNGRKTKNRQSHLIKTLKTKNSRTTKKSAITFLIKENITKIQNTLQSIFLN